jgi:hypothetical protein
MTKHVKGIDGLYQEQLKINSKITESTAKLARSLELLNNLIKEYGMPKNKDRGIAHIALDAVLFSNEVIDGLMEEISFKNMELNGYDKVVEKAFDNIIEKSELNDNLKEQRDKLDIERGEQKNMLNLRDAILKQSVVVIKEKDAQITDATAPRKGGTEATKRKAILWQEKINDFVKVYKDEYPHHFSGEKCTVLYELEYFVKKKLARVADPALKNKKAPHRIKPPVHISKKINDALNAIFDG